MLGEPVTPSNINVKALEIAREMCARDADKLGNTTIASAYRRGEFDTHYPLRNAKLGAFGALLFMLAPNRYDAGELPE